MAEAEVSNAPAAGSTSRPESGDHAQNTAPASTPKASEPKTVDTTAPATTSVSQDASSLPAASPSLPEETVAPFPELPPYTLASHTSDKIFIAIMGKTGTGKTNFINQVTEANLETGGSLRSCTEDIQTASTVINGVHVTLIDTPGFDDDRRDDSEILTLIGAWLKQAHGEDRLLTGIIYMHNILDVRMAGSSIRSLYIMQKMCGTTNYQNIVLATTWWDKVDLKLAEQREQELKETNDFWKPMIDGGAMVCRHYNTKASAEEIVKSLLPKEPIVLEFQKELSVHGTIGQTTAGGYIMKFLEDLRNDSEDKLSQIQTQLAALEKDQADAEDQKKKLEKTVAKLSEDIRSLMTKVDDLVQDARAGKRQSPLMIRLRRLIRPSKV